MDSTRRLENAHVALWLLKDYAWCTSVRWLGIGMALPTVALALILARRSWRNLEDFTHNAAVCCWILANIVWMLGEFFFQDHTRPFARVLFTMGLGCLAVYYAWCAVEWLRDRWLGDLITGGPIARAIDRFDADLRDGRLDDDAAVRQLEYLRLAVVSRKVELARKRWRQS
jgi:hypothetical protein